MTHSPKDAFDKLASMYEGQVDQDSPYNTDYERPAMVRMLPDQLEGLAILDAGCSEGWYSKTLIEKGADVTAIDISPKMAEAAKRKTGGAARIICHDLNQPLSFEDHTFDMIVSSLTLHYCKDWFPIFKEFSRVLKPKGQLLFSTHHPFMDFKQFNCENYFDEVLLHDTWKKAGTSFEVSFYRKPMEKIVTETSRFFVIDELTEPRGTESFKKNHPGNYEYLMTNPHFLIIKATSRKQED
ncbi:ubiquinone biosynthesis methyltransferase UbiE [Bacillus sp. HMSC76G11]|uniref:Methyltransferase domain-containing protein n=1 Tax=Metabacillus idriensis TaxID=324768 RepID=A0A6I2MDJ9_9BACI|nr:class I SAM-dependent methyltransferase [Metabacillus idriensis]MRX55809.1 methyltransferase domain-containing protein [Metabacillus idriensis]OHR63386.1 ubiquinone biosynthesis methyltransferase UbiE [Bacillus sp. HMSC76G11]